MAGWHALREKVCKRVASGRGRWEHIDGDASDFESFMSSIDLILISDPTKRWSWGDYADRMKELGEPRG